MGKKKGKVKGGDTRYVAMLPGDGSEYVTDVFGPGDKPQAVLVQAAHSKWLAEVKREDAGMFEELAAGEPDGSLMRDQLVMAAELQKADAEYLAALDRDVYTVIGWYTSEDEAHELAEQANQVCVDGLKYWARFAMPVPPKKAVADFIRDLHVPF